MTNPFRSRAEKIMVERNITWYALAKRSGLPLGSVYGYRDGVTPSVYHAIAIAAALGVNPLDLWKMEDVREATLKKSATS